MHCGSQKADKILDELEKVGLIEKQKQGMGKANKLFVKQLVVKGMVEIKMNLFILESITRCSILQDKAPVRTFPLRHPCRHIGSAKARNGCR